MSKRTIDLNNDRFYWYFPIKDLEEKISFVREQSKRLRKVFGKTIVKEWVKIDGMEQAMEWKEILETLEKNFENIKACLDFDIWHHPLEEERCEWRDTQRAISKASKAWDKGKAECKAGKHTKVSVSSYGRPMSIERYKCRYCDKELN